MEASGGRKKSRREREREGRNQEETESDSKSLPRIPCFSCKWDFIITWPVLESSLIDAPRFIIGGVDDKCTMQGSVISALRFLRMYMWQEGNRPGMDPSGPPGPALRNPPGEKIMPRSNVLFTSSPVSGLSVVLTLSLASTSVGMFKACSAVFVFKPSASVSCVPFGESTKSPLQNLTTSSNASSSHRSHHLQEVVYRPSARGQCAYAMFCY